MWPLVDETKPTDGNIWANDKKGNAILRLLFSVCFKFVFYVTAASASQLTETYIFIVPIERSFAFALVEEGEIGLWSQWNAQILIDKDSCIQWYYDLIMKANFNQYIEHLCLLPTLSASPIPLVCVGIRSLLSIEVFLPPVIQYVFPAQFNLKFVESVSE